MVNVVACGKFVTRDVVKRMPLSPPDVNEIVLLPDPLPPSNSRDRAVHVGYSQNETKATTSRFNSQGQEVLLSLPKILEKKL